MTPEEFAQFVREVIAEEITVDPACACCGISEISFGDAVQRITEQFTAAQKQAA